MEAIALTPPQRRLFDYLKTFADSYGTSPTLREMQAYLGLASTNGVRELLVRLEAKGVLVRHAKKTARNFVVSDEMQGYRPRPRAALEASNEGEELARALSLLPSSRVLAIVARAEELRRARRM